MTTALASSVSGRVERQIKRVLSVALLISLPEILANSAAQRFFLNGLSAVILFLLIGTTVATAMSAWVTSGNRVWFYLHGISVGLSLISWPFMVIDASLLPQGTKPWIWWTMGIGILSIGLVGNRILGVLSLVSYSIGWFVLHSSEVGGGASVAITLQDSMYLFLFGGSIIGLVTLVRDGAKRADIANTNAIQLTIEQASVDAVERERQRLDALIHDKVLNTLILAAKADTKEQQKHVAELASQAIHSLEAATKEPSRNSAVTPIGLFRALRKAAIQLVPGIEVQSMSGGAETIPADKAEALTEATLQAIDNARAHSKATKFLLTLDSPGEGIVEISLLDNGVGFRPEKIPRDRVGLRTSILARMQSVGGSAQISSDLGRGTKIVLRWPK